MALVSTRRDGERWNDHLTLTRRISGVGAGVLAAVIAQASYGFSFTAYDPYSADPLVFVFAAIIAWCWVEDRWRAALVAGLIGIFAKETVALVSLSCVMAAAINRERATRAPGWSPAWRSSRPCSSSTG